MGKIGKQKLPFLRNRSYCRILLALNSDRLIAQEISKRASIDASTIIRHLQFLTHKDQGFINIELVKRTKYYSVDWRRVTEEFIAFLTDKAEEFNKYIVKWRKSSAIAKVWAVQGIIASLNKGEMPFQQLFNQEVVERLKSNPLLQGFLSNLFREIQDKKPDKISLSYSLNDIFSYIIGRIFISDNQKIVFSCLDPNNSLRIDLEGDYKTALEGVRKHLKGKGEAEGEIRKIIDELNKYDLNEEERDYLFDYVELLPRIFDDINKNWEFETVILYGTPTLEKIAHRSIKMVAYRYEYKSFIKKPEVV